MKKNQLILNIFLFFVFILTFWFNAYAEWNDDKIKSIKELKNNIEILKSKKVINFSIFEKFKNANWDLTSYFPSNLKEEEIKKIEQIISEYNIKKNLIIKENNTKENSEKYNKKLLEIKKELYFTLEKFVLEEKKELYKVFIEKKNITFKKNLEIKKELNNNKEILQTKVIIIKEKIEKNHKKEQEKLDFILKEKIKKRILFFQNSKKIRYLSKEKQKILFEVVLNRIQKIKNWKKYTKEKKKLLYILEEVLINTIQKLN